MKWAENNQQEHTIKFLFVDKKETEAIRAFLLAQSENLKPVKGTMKKKKKISYGQGKYPAIVQIFLGQASNFFLFVMDGKNTLCRKMLLRFPRYCHTHSWSLMGKGEKKPTSQC